jgi:hypothetical protein
MIFIKTKIISLFKFHPKLNRTPCQHQLNCVTCSIIIIFSNIKKFFFRKKEKYIKNFDFGGG